MEARELFLTSEERYDVYCVKSSERPHLLETFTETPSDEKVELPLMDGCDIPNWRSEKLVPGPSQWEAALNVGLGCPLLRRERQLPLPKASVTNNNCSPWETLQQLLLQQPTTESVQRIQCSLASQHKPISSSNDAITQQNSDKQFVPPRQKHFSRWEEENYPVIITEATTEDGWNLDVWRYESLVNRFGDVRWRFSDTHGAMMSLSTYAKYVVSEGNNDDSPLAVYDSEFGDDSSPMHELIDDYKVPPCFSDDLFALALPKNQVDNKTHTDHQTDIPGLARATPDDSSKSSSASEEDEDCDSASNDDEHDRPPFRWILMGPPRSGTGLHIDPLWTNAWVTLLEGLKRWVLIPPHLTDKLPDGAGLREPQVPSVIWFRDYYQKVIQLEGAVEILQRPGETVFVPNGWPHLVLNLERTVAVTHNYASEFGPFECMWDQVVEDEPEFAQRWYRGLCRHRPDLAARIECQSSSK